MAGGAPEALPCAAQLLVAQPGTVVLDADRGATDPTRSDGHRARPPWPRPAFALAARGYGLGSWGEMGAGMFPFLLGLLLVALGIAVAVGFVRGGE
nr:hypothetical protein [Nocardioides litoris]